MLLRYFSALCCKQNYNISISINPFFPIFTKIVKNYYQQTFDYLSHMQQTNEQYDHVIQICHGIFEKKMMDYGSAWRILRTTSMTDQIYIKAQRIRSIEDKGIQQVDDDLRSEYIGIINYCAMAIIQYELGPSFKEDLSAEEIIGKYAHNLNTAKELMMRKNHDYGEAWRNMRISSYTDLILMKLMRIKQIENNKGKTIISEGIDANYLDMINYAVFAMIKIEFGEE
jgi:hypothetical protein